MIEAYYIDEREHVASVAEQFVQDLLSELQSQNCPGGPLLPPDSPRLNCILLQVEMASLRQEVHAMPGDLKEFGGVISSMHEQSSKAEHKLPYKARQPFYGVLIIALHLIVSALLPLYAAQQKPIAEVQRVLPGMELNRANMPRAVVSRRL